MVVRIEGSSEEQTVHANLLCASSIFFNNLINNLRIQDGRDNIVEVTNGFGTYDMKAFRIYVQWLYTGHVHTKPPVREPSLMGEWENLLTGYRLACFIADFDYMNTLADAMVECLTEWIGSGADLEDL